MVNCINLIIEMSPRFILGRENVPYVAEVVNRSLKADCTDYIIILVYLGRYTIKHLLAENSVHTENICSDVQGAWTP